MVLFQLKNSQVHQDDSPSEDDSSYSDGDVSAKGKYACLRCSQRFFTLKGRSEHAQNTHVEEITCKTSHGRCWIDFSAYVD